MYTNANYEKINKLFKKKGQVRNTNTESLLVFPITKGRFHKVWGIGVVRRITKGDEFDMIEIDFGTGAFWRKIYLKNVNARKQLYTCKVGQYAEIYGEICDAESVDRKLPPIRGFAVQGWFVPKIVDIRQTPLEEEEIEVMDKEEYDDGADFLTQFER